MNDDKKKATAFVLMSFDSEFDEVYEQFISEALEKAGYEVCRADNILSHRNILQDIINSIIVSDLVVADLTGANPNVFYELGLAHAFKKPTILLTQDLDEVPFDLRSYRVLNYETHFAKIQEASEKLYRLAKGALEEKVHFSSPVMDFEASGSLVLSKVSDTENNSDLEFLEDVDDRGYLDHLIDLEEYFVALTVIIDDVNNATEEIGGKTNKIANEINEANRRGGSGTISFVRKLARGHAGNLKKYTEKILDANERYGSVSHSLDRSLEFIVTFQQSVGNDGDEIKSSLAGFLEKLASVEPHVVDGGRAMESFADTVDSMPKMEKNLDRATRQASGELHRLIINIEKTVATMRRAQEVGKKMLSGM